MDWNLANPIWAQTLNPVINNPLLQGQLISNLSLSSSNSQTFNHGLGRNMKGWFIVDINSEANIWRTAPFNASTLTLTANAETTFSIWVF
jgi:hypothetical protein